MSAVHRDPLLRGLYEMPGQDHRRFIELAADQEAASFMPWNDKWSSRGVPGHLDFG
jgi:hypothetical protein